MAIFNVKVRDKSAPKNEMTLRVNGQPTKEAAQKYIEDHPGSIGGTHKGFEVLSVTEEGTEVAEAAPQVQA